ncbi:MAG: T9SS type A sorting domain-containing protein, partial [Bacteroidales bacterium]|nr:T9SS type A sorting domain-containing protein [Bacteroidales bacterium]
AINTVDTSGWSDTWQFHTTDRVILNSPSNDTSSTGSWYTRQVFQWRNSQGSSSYILQLDTTPDFNSSVLRSFTKTNSHTDTYVSYVVNDMRYGTTYYWRVCAINTVDTSGWSDTWQFHTTDRVILNSPSNDTSSTGSWYTRQVFQWRNSQGSSSYILQLDTTPDFNSPILRSFTSTNSQSNTDTYFSYIVNDMRYGTTYYWRVCSINAVDTSGWSDTWQFHTTDHVVLRSPANTSIGMSVSSTQLSWYNSTGSTSYLVQWDTSSTFSSSLLDSYTMTASGTSFADYFYKNISGLRYGTTYYWRVRSANNAPDTSGWSDTWHFTTSYQLTTGPVLTAPANDTIGIPYNSSVAFSWQPIENVQGYYYQISTSNDFSTIIAQGNTSLTFTSVSNFSPTTTYYWRVRGYNNSGNSVWSQVWHFTTNDVVLTPPVLVSPANDATVQTSNITLTWQSVFGANSYELQFSMDANFATAVTNFTTTGTQYSLTGIPDNTTLYWRVRATNGNTFSDWSAPWHFTTNECQTSSYAFSHSICNGESYEFFGQTLTTSGDYSQVLTNADGCDSIVTLHLTVFPTESTEFSETAFDSYTWNGQTYTESGDYTQTLTNIHGCDSTVTLHLTLTVGIDDWAESISISPNPTYGKLRIKNGELKLQNIRILDVFGKQVTTIPIDERQAEIDFSSCAAGVYLLKIETENGVAVRKVVKK